MQNLRQIRSLLSEAGAQPRRQLGQCFLIDLNLMRRLLELAEVESPLTVLEVGPGTGSLTEELLERAGRVVAVEYDRKLAALLRRRFAGREGLKLIEADALAGKHRIAREVLAAVAPRAQMVSNLPYQIATPLVAECLLESWRSLRGEGVCFDRLTFTVQQEVAERFSAKVGTSDYGPVSVLAGLLGRITAGPTLPATAFWPRPKVASRMLRIDFDAPAGRELRDAEVLRALLHQAFTQRRKHILSTARARGARFDAESLAAALRQEGVDPASRADEISPRQYLRTANVLSES